MDIVVAGCERLDDGLDPGPPDRVGDQFCYPGHDNTPTGARHRVDLVGLKSEDATVRGRRQPGAFSSPEHHGVIKERERHRDHGRKCRVREDDTPDNLARQQLD